MYKNTQNITKTVSLSCNNSTFKIMKRLQLLKPFFFSLILLVCITNCTKDDVNSNQQLTHISVKLKSTVGTYNKVFVEIEDVQLKVREGENASNAWVSLNAINQGTYNIFDLRDNSELLLVNNFELKSTYVYEIRLVLGDNNFIDIDNILYSLDVTDFGNSTPSNLVKLDLNSNHTYDFVINIDIDNSVNFNEEQNMMVLDPNLYTEITQYYY